MPPSVAATREAPRTPPVALARRAPPRPQGRDGPLTIQHGDSCAWALDPYRGCELGCLFCPRGQGALANPSAGTRERWLRALRAQLARLERQASPLGFRRGGGRTVPRVTIQLGVVSEPYQPRERELGLTRRALELICDESFACVEVCTRSDSVLDDLDLLRRLSQEGRVRVTLSCSSLPDDLLACFEPFSPPLARRLEVIERLARSGVPVGVNLSPVFPGLGDDRRSLRRVVCAAAQAGASYARGRVLRMPESVRGAITQRIEERALAQVPRYLRTYGRRPHRGGQPKREVSERVETTLRGLRSAYRLAEALEWRPLPIGLARGARSSRVGDDRGRGGLRRGAQSESPRRLPSAGAAAQIGLFDAA